MKLPTTTITRTSGLEKLETPSGRAVAPKVQCTASICVKIIIEFFIITEVFLKNTYVSTSTTIIDIQIVT